MYVLLECLSEKMHKLTLNAKWEFYAESNFEIIIHIQKQ